MGGPDHSPADVARPLRSVPLREFSAFPPKALPPDGADAYAGSSSTFQ